MGKKHNKTKYQTYGKRKIHKNKKQAGKILMSSAVASTLVFQPFIPVIQNGQVVGFTQESAEAAPLAEVGLFSDSILSAQVGNEEGTEPYTLDLTLTGTSLADIGLVNPDTVAVFYAPDLAGAWETAGPATVQVDLTAITLDDLPALGNFISGLTGTLTGAVSDLTSGLDSLLNLIPSSVLNIEGVDTLSNAVDSLNNVDQALADALSYQDQVPVTNNGDGVMSVDFSDGLDQYLDTAVEDVVLQLLYDVQSAASGVNITLLEGINDIPLIGLIIDQVNNLLNGVLSTVTDVVLPTVNDALDQVVSGTVDLTGNLAAAQVIGPTTITVPTTVSKTAGINGTVPISGNVVNTTNVLDVELLSDLGRNTVPVEFTDALAPAITPIADSSTLENVAINNIPVEVSEPSTITTNGLPTGLAYDESAGAIVGTPVVDDWTAVEEDREFNVTVTATDEAGNASEERFTLTIQRDTDGDGVPDVDDEDDDNDGATDDEENEAGTDPKDENDTPGTETPDTTAPAITTIEDTTAIENEPIESIAVEVNEPSGIETEGLPIGLAYDQSAGAIVGTPVVDDWTAVEEDREFNVTVTATDEAGNASEERFTLTIQRDTDGDGVPDVDDEDDDNDGVTDEEENEAGTDPKDETDVPDFEAPTITEIDDATAIENEPIENIAVEVSEPSDIETEGLPTGLTYNETAGAIVGTPVVEDWLADEEERTFDVTVTATDDAGNASEETFVLTIQRDTDGDGLPDLEDEDDDNDGVPDEEENEAGTDPKDETDVPDLEAPGISPIANTSALENTPIEGIAVEVDEPSEIETEGLPTGLAYDADAGAITGTPVVDDWELVEEERGFEVTVTATDQAGNTSTETFNLTIQRDTDGDGIPDVDDEDDDNDGATDDEENEAGTDPKDESDTPGEDIPVDPEAPVITPIANTFVLENQAIDPIDVLVEGASEVITAGLPAGLAYDAESSTITGTPVVEDWRVSEEQRGSLVTITATNEEDETSEETFALVVQRDTDGDGIPDVTDEDDDNDGATDEEENEVGTDPKDETDVPDFEAPTITEIDDATAIENEPIENIAVEVSEPSDIETEGLPTGLAYNEAAGAIVGTPVVEDWEADEEERTFDVTVTATDDAGNASEETFVLTIQRDTDGDGLPDLEDEDDDNDGVTDEEENEAGTDPKDETDVPDLVAPEITEINDATAVENEPIENIAVEVNEPSDIETEGLPTGLTYNETAGGIVGTPVVEDWEADEEERTFDVTVTATDEAGNASEENFALVIQRDTDSDGSPDVDDEDDDNDGATDEEENEAGTDPKDETDTPEVEAPEVPESPVINEVTSEDTEVTGTAELGTEVVVTLPNGDTVSGTTDENGEFTVTLPEELDLTGGETLEIVAVDEEGNESDPTVVTVADVTPPIILEIDDQTVVEASPIEDIEIVIENPGEEQTIEPEPIALQTLAAVNLIQPFAAPIDAVLVEGLPDGVAFDIVTNVIGGIPEVSDWEATEEERDFEVTVVARDEANNEATETFTITVQRDTDGDGIPDVTDTDDDNDGVSDEEEAAAGTDPKDETDTPALTDTVAPVITPIDDVTAVENTPIADITVEVDEPSLLIATGLPSGIAFDEETGVISGAAVIDDWDVEEEERTFNATITARDAAGNESEETLGFTVQRDTDGDGTPDVTDTDDDNDGATDTEENEAGTDPKDPSDTPAEETPSEDTEAPIITPIPDISGEENQPIEDVVVEVNEPSEVVVDGLPSGITYDPETGVISGTPVIDDWAEGETERTYDVTITAEDEARNVSAIELSITITRDLAEGDNETGTPGAGDSNVDNDGTAGDGDNTAGDNQDGESSDASDQETLPQTGESQNIWKAFSGSVMAAVGAFMLAWNKKKNTFTKKK